ncbi:GNAT family N-acetyltransferase [Clostridium oryzae]|uniref:Ribosomal-protein-alanine N-acetyltransferase n=1 Tax=Clostridium oryzae TaxID=1450648 RepID=A0A1V4IQ96_9CLOT|nr:GNAT family N-acetyltransferase [Clostridium oryzae]OPJ62096.1 ribosomal-protein-alanine N-acetyltransferase [Clostridium oryzae]
MIQKIEQMSMKANPSTETLSYDGWIIRFSDSFTKEANSINPLFSSSYPVEVKINSCEELFRSKNLPIIYKLTDSTENYSLDSALIKRNYVQLPGARVCLLNLNIVNGPEYRCIKVYNKPSSVWINYFFKFTEIDAKHSTLLMKLYNKIIPTAIYLLILVNDIPVGCGLGIVENDYLGLFNLCIDKNMRGNGYGKQLVLNLLEQGKKNGAKYSYLQVGLDNLIAYNLYKSIGFTELYNYWYRAKI